MEGEGGRKKTRKLQECLDQFSSLLFSMSSVPIQTITEIRAFPFVGKFPGDQKVITIEGNLQKNKSPEIKLLSL